MRFSRSGLSHPSTGGDTLYSSGYPISSSGRDGSVTWALPYPIMSLGSSMIMNLIIPPRSGFPLVILEPEYVSKAYLLVIVAGSLCVIREARDEI